MSKTTYFKSMGEEGAEKVAQAILYDGKLKRNITALAKEIDESPETVRRWLKNPRTMPLRGAIAMCGVIGKGVNL